MTESKTHITISTDDDWLKDDTITIDLDHTSTDTSFYDSVGDITLSIDTARSSYTLDEFTTSTIDLSDWLGKSTDISPNEVERMCKEYPALEKVWRNFKSVYDMVRQDYNGKKTAGELDDDIPF